MFEKIVVAYDGSACGIAALRQGADLARLAGAELHLLGIVVTTGYMALAEGSGAIDVWGTERKNLQTALDAAVRALSAAGIGTIVSIREGEPADEIIAYARAISADLILLGHARQGLIGRWLRGSLGNRLLSHPPCSLLMAKDPA